MIEDRNAPVPKFITTRSLANGKIQSAMMRQARSQRYWTIAGDGWTTYKNEDVHDTVELALARAKQKQADKIASLRKQITKLEAMVFA